MWYNKQIFRFSLIIESQICWWALPIIANGGSKSTPYVFLPYGKRSFGQGLPPMANAHNWNTHKFIKVSVFTSYVSFEWVQIQHKLGLRSMKAITLLLELNTGNLVYIWIVNQIKHLYYMVNENAQVGTKLKKFQ